MDSQSSDLVGFFRDGKRRVDIVLVTKDGVGAEAEELTTDFLINAVKLGLEMEVEEGKHKDNKFLTFIKVHTPASLIEEYGLYFNVRKYFKESHDEFLHPRNEFIKKHFPKIDNFIVRNTLNIEKDWLRLIRNNYQDSKNYSNLERSVITFKILMLIPYRTDEFHIGIKWLLKHNVILDAYALHDGPYFKIKDYTKENLPNARQLLYNNWVKRWIVLRQQPVHLINEYFGERVAFYFEFFGMYNKALIISAIFGIITTVFGCLDYLIGRGVWKSTNVCYREAQIRQLNREHMPDLVCPMCKDFFLCPFTNVSDYCTQAKIVDLIDSRFSPFYALFISVWAILFISIWKRREQFLLWIWEINVSRTTYMRPEFLNELDFTRSRSTGIIKKRYSKLHLFFRSFFSLAVITFSVIGMLLITLILVILKYKVLMFPKSLSPDTRHFLVGILFALINAGVSVILESVCKKLSYMLTEFENHRTEDVYERSLVLKLTVLTLTYTYSYFIYFAFIRELFFTYPTDANRWDWLGGIAYNNCGAISCFDDLYLILFSMIFVKQIINRLLVLLKNLIFGMRTDYNQKSLMSANIPCWEREFRLQPVTEELLMDKYRLLIFQFSLVTWFVSVFPLASALTLPINIWDISANAKQFLLGFRRPLFLKSSGPGAWGKILVAMAFIAGLTNSLAFVCTSQVIDRYIYKTYTDDILRLNSSAYILNYFDYSSGFVPLEDYTNSNNTRMREEFLKYYEHSRNWRWLHEFIFYKRYEDLSFCRFIGKKGKTEKKSKIVITKDIGWYEYYIDACFVFMFQHVCLVLVFIFYYLIPKLPRDVRETMAIEEKVKAKRTFESSNKVL